MRRKKFFLIGNCHFRTFGLSDFGFSDFPKSDFGDDPRYLFSLWKKNFGVGYGASKNLNALKPATHRNQSFPWPSRVEKCMSRTSSVNTLHARRDGAYCIFGTVTHTHPWGLRFFFFSFTTHSRQSCAWPPQVEKWTSHLSNVKPHAGRAAGSTHHAP